MDIQQGEQEILGTAETLSIRAANGDILPGAAHTGGAMIDLLEDGALAAELHTGMRDLARTMREETDRTGNKTKGKVVLTLDFSREDGAFRIQGDIKVVKPKQPRQRSVMWTDSNDNFTRFPPNQGQFFNARPTR